MLLTPTTRCDRSDVTAIVFLTVCGRDSCRGRRPARLLDPCNVSPTAASRILGIDIDHVRDHAAGSGVGVPDEPDHGYFVLDSIDISGLPLAGRRTGPPAPSRPRRSAHRDPRRARFPTQWDHRGPGDLDGAGDRSEEPFDDTSIPVLGRFGDARTLRTVADGLHRTGDALQDSSTEIIGVRRSGRSRPRPRVSFCRCACRRGLRPGDTNGDARIDIMDDRESADRHRDPPRPWRIASTTTTARRSRTGSCSCIIFFVNGAPPAPRSDQNDVWTMLPASTTRRPLHPDPCGVAAATSVVRSQRVSK